MILRVVATLESQAGAQSLRAALSGFTAMFKEKMASEDKAGSMALVDVVDVVLGFERMLLNCRTVGGQGNRIYLQLLLLLLLCLLMLQLSVAACFWIAIRRTRGPECPPDTPVLSWTLRGCQSPCSKQRPMLSVSRRCSCVCVCKR